MSTTHEEHGKIFQDYNVAKQKRDRVIEKARKMIAEIGGAAAELERVLSGYSPSPMASNLPSSEEYAQIIQDLGIAHENFGKCSSSWEKIKPKE